MVPKRIKRGKEKKERERKRQRVKIIVYNKGCLCVWVGGQLLVGEEGYLCQELLTSEVLLGDEYCMSKS